MRYNSSPAWKISESLRSVSPTTYSNNACITVTYTQTYAYRFPYTIYMSYNTALHIYSKQYISRTLCTYYVVYIFTVQYNTGYTLTLCTRSAQGTERNRQCLLVMWASQSDSAVLPDPLGPCSTMPEIGR